MKKVKILQSGDFHLDSPLILHNNNFRRRRKVELLEAVSNIVNIGNKKEVDLLLLTGDIFDSKRVTRNTIMSFTNILGKFTGNIFISPGNHDPYTVGSIYDSFKFPENTHIFNGYEKIYLEKLDVYVHGIGFRDYYEEKDLFNLINIENKNSINILVTHGEINSGENSYHPISLESIANSDLDYIAIGHRHNYSGIKMEEGTYYGYAGIPEPRGYDELGDKGIIYGDIYKGLVDLNFIKTNKRSYLEIDVDISNTQTSFEIIKIIDDMSLDKENIYRFNLKGSILEHVIVDINSIKNYLKDEFYDFDIKDFTYIKETKDKISDRSLQGIFLNTIKEKEASFDDKEMLKEAKKIGLRLLSQGEILW